MKTIQEIREEARKLLWTERWLGRLLSGWCLLVLAMYAIQGFLGRILNALNVDDWQDYQLAVLMNLLDVTSPVPNLTTDYIIRATSATLFESFISYILSGIVAYGSAVLLLKCLRNDENDWLREAFGGFQCPFALFGLFFRLMLIYIGCGLLIALFPPLGIALIIVAFYCYRFAFLIKAEHPDWSAGECMRASRTMMKGHKMESFRLDCSYWKPITLVLLCFLAGTVCALLDVYAKDQSSVSLVYALLAFVLLIGGLVGSLILGKCISVGQALFYQEIKSSS